MWDAETPFIIKIPEVRITQLVWQVAIILNTRHTESLKLIFFRVETAQSDSGVHRNDTVTSNILNFLSLKKWLSTQETKAAAKLV